jgi:hypothetical protein
MHRKPPHPPQPDLPSLLTSLGQCRWSRCRNEQWICQGSSLLHLEEWVSEQTRQGEAQDPGRLLVQLEEGCMEWKEARERWSGGPGLAEMPVPLFPLRNFPELFLLLLLLLSPAQVGFPGNSPSPASLLRPPPAPGPVLLGQGHLVLHPSTKWVSSSSGERSI